MSSDSPSPAAPLPLRSPPTQTAQAGQPTQQTATHTQQQHIHSRVDVAAGAAAAILTLHQTIGGACALAGSMLVQPPSKPVPRPATDAATASSSVAGGAQQSSAAFPTDPKLQGQRRSGLAWLSWTASALGQPRSQTLQPQKRQAAASTSGQPSIPPSRSNQIVGGAAPRSWTAALSLAVLSSSAPSVAPLSLSSSSAASDPKPIPTLKSSDTRHERHKTLKQRSNKDGAGKRDAAAHAPFRAAAHVNGAAAGGAAAAAHTPQTASHPVQPSASSLSAAAASSLRTFHSPSVASDPAVWIGVTCDGCSQSPLIGVCFRCTVCSDFDLCADCKKKRIHTETHPMQRFNTPAELEQQLQPVQRQSAAPRASGDAASDAAAALTASQLPSSSAAAASHSRSMAEPDADDAKQAAGDDARLLADSQRRDDDSDEELSEGQVPNSSDGSHDDDDAEMGPAATAATSHPTAASGAAALPAFKFKEIALPDAILGNLPRRLMVRSQNKTEQSTLSDAEDAPAASAAARRIDSRERHAVRALPDFYADRLSGTRVDRPTRKTTETTREFCARYNRWRKRGKEVWTPADLEQAKQLRMQQQKSTQQPSDKETNERAIAAASSSSAAASGAQDPARRSTRRASAVSVAKDDDGSDSSAAASDDGSDGGSDSSCGSESIPPRPTLAECRGNQVRLEVRLAEWKARYGDRSEAEQADESLSRAQRQACISRKGSCAERSDVGAAAPTPPHIAGRVPVKHPNVTKPDFYIDQTGQRVNRPAHAPGESSADYKRRYNAWLKAGNAVWTKEERDAATGREATAIRDDSSSDEDDDSDNEASEESQAASLSPHATHARKQPASRPQRHAASNDGSKVNNSGDADDAESDDGQPLGSAPSFPAVPHAHGGRRRTLPDSFVDPKTGQVMKRPVRAVGEGEAAFSTRYKCWRRRGLRSGAPGFAVAGVTEPSQPVATLSSAAAAAPSASASSSTQQQQLGLSNMPPELMSLFVAGYNAGQAAAGGAHAAAPLLTSQLQAPAHAAAAAASALRLGTLLSSPALDAAAMRDDDEADNADAPSMPALNGSRSSSAHSSHLQRVTQPASTGGGAASSLATPPVDASAAGSATKGKRKADSRDHSDRADRAGTENTPGASTHASKKACPSASPVPQPVIPRLSVASGGAPQSAASSSDSADVRSFLLARLAATSSLELILAECISDPGRHAACLTAFTDGDVSLADLERDFTVYFPRVGVPPLVQWGLITAGPAAKLQSIIRQRIELKQQLDDDCIEVKREARAAGK